MTLRRLGRVESAALLVAQAGQRERPERICRYVSRSAVANERLSLTSQGKVRYALKGAYRDGTTHVIFEPLDFLSRLAAPVPKPKVNLIRFHGVFAPNRRLRAQIVPDKGDYVATRWHLLRRKLALRLQG